MARTNEKNAAPTGAGKYYGKLPPEIVADLDKLLLKLQAKNRTLLKKKVIKSTEFEQIKTLDHDENIRLWEYIRHCCDLVSTWPNVRRAIGVFSEKSGMSFESLHEEFVNSVTTFVYTYAWRKYKHSDDCEYVFSTAIYGYKAWAYEQNCFHSGSVAAKELFDADNPSSGRKVSSN